MRQAGLMITVLVTAASAGCEKASRDSTPPTPLLDASPGPRFPPRPDSFPACSTDYAPRPDRDASPMCYVRGGAYEVIGLGFERRDERDRVELDDFLIDQHEVTAERFARFLNEAWPITKCENPDNLCEAGSRHPPPVLYRDGKFVARAGLEKVAMFGVSREQVAAYCAWVGKEIPTYAQWDVAAHVAPDGARRTFPWGDEPDLKRMNCAEDVCADGFVETAPPGSLGDTSGWGAWDMAGNIDELVRGCPGDGSSSSCPYFSVGSQFSAPERQDVFHTVKSSMQRWGVRCATTTLR